MTTFRNILIAGWILSIIICYSVAHPIQDVVEAHVIDVAVPQEQLQEQKTEEAQPTPIPEVYDTPEKYIKFKFGQDADKAFLLLRGNGSPDSCAENRNLDPKAVNDNRTWGGVGVDRGMFQINSVYHPLTEVEAFDWKANIDYAYRMFKNDGNTFSKRWVCGKWYKSLGYDI